MNPQENLIDHLEAALTSQGLSRRAEVLRRVTDLFALGSGKFSDDQVDLFSDVMGKLVDSIEVAARAAFGSRMATMSDAPRGVIRKLAFDDAIEVAGPVLAQSERLDDATLVENARTKGQQHLLAISGRTILTEAVTDILVDRGDQHVVRNTAGNGGAKFSDFGFSTIVAKSKNDGDLALCIWSRPDIPRQELVKLFVQASEAVRSKLEKASPRQAHMIRAAVAEASDEIQTKARAGSHEHSGALSQVRALHASGHLNEACVLAFAQARDFDRIAVALSLMCDLPIGLIERALVQSRTEQILVFAKALDLSWGTAKALLVLQAGRDGVAKDQLEQCFASFSRLQSKTARTALQFYRLREKAGERSLH